ASLIVSDHADGPVRERAAQGDLQIERVTKDDALLRIPVDFALRLLGFELVFERLIDAFLRLEAKLPRELDPHEIIARLAHHVFVVDDERSRLIEGRSLAVGPRLAHGRAFLSRARRDELREADAEGILLKEGAERRALRPREDLVEPIDRTNLAARQVTEIERAPDEGFEKTREVLVAIGGVGLARVVAEAPLPGVHGEARRLVRERHRGAPLARRFLRLERADGTERSPLLHA